MNTATRTLKEVEATYLTEIEIRCRTGDKEFNGGELDALICEFLAEIGCKKLAKAHKSVEAWRA